jgi:hypothetical protein
MTSWIAVASENHVARGRAGGFMQVCHGKNGPLSRIKPGDDVIYYSPSSEMGGGVPLKSFTAAGKVKDGAPYQYDMGGGFIPFRRDVEWYDGKATGIAHLLDALELTRGKRNWGYVFRFGVVKISDDDRNVILAAMGAGK